MSFRNEVVLSFEATKDNTFEDYHVVEVAPGVRLLRFAMVYGANASGKSNLLYALDFLYEFVFAKTKDLEERTGVAPFKLDAVSPNQPSEFSLKFYIGSTKYWYELVLDQHKVHLERLYYYTSTQPTKLFERTWADGESVITFNPSVIKISPTAKDELALRCLPNMSFFAARRQVNVAMKEIDAAREWFKTGIMPIIGPRSKMFEYASEKIVENAQLKQYLLNFVSHADFNISDVKTNVVDRNIQTQFVHTVFNSRGTESYTLPATEQSEGTRRTMGVETAVFQAIQDNAFLAIDEIDASLHPELVEFVIQNFLTQKSRAQLLVTTHYDPLLNTVGNDLIRRDSVWFTEKDGSGNTDLYSLVEYKGLNRIRSLQKAYRNGVFGALPIIK